MTRRLFAVAVLLSAAAGALPADAAPRRPIEETDLFRFVWVADPQISPDGTRVAFVRVAVSDKKDGYDTALWVVDTDGRTPPRPFTSGPRDLAPRWSPDGRWIAFTRSAETAGRPGDAQIHVIASDGGEARALTDLPRGASAPVWSPDGRTLAFLSTANARDLEKKNKKKSGPAEGEPERESDVRVITRAVYRFNGRGWLDAERPAHVWTVPATPGDDPAPPRQVTSGSFEEGAPVFSTDGRRLLFTSRRVKEPSYGPDDADLYSVPVEGGEPVLVASIDGPIGAFALAPDGRRIAFQGEIGQKPPRSYDQQDLFLFEAGAAPRLLTGEADVDVGGGLTGDQRAPRGGQPSGPVWWAAGRSLVVRTADHGRANLHVVDLATGRLQPLTTGNQEVLGFTATPEGARMALVLSTPTRIGDVYVLDAATRTPRRLTDLNAALLAELNLTEPEDVTYPSFDGRTIHALVQKPPDYQPGRRYPLILNIHGGPHAAYGYTFFHEMQWMAAKGYVVLYPNPRGSTSYGQEFGNLIQHRYPGDDVKDLLAGVDELVRRALADEKRLGVTGGSGGGVLTNAIIGQTDRFAAAVSQRSIADWTAWWYTGDFTLFEPTWFKGAPFENPGDFTARSPITYASKIKTPLMLIEGDVDLRTPPAAGGEAMFRALKYLRRPVVMVRFPEESHELSRSGKPWHRIERLRHIVAWFDKYLKGETTIAYDVP
jgi:dipeptidyl aminopeptidase/acylaminoacyl peptidase